MGCGCRKPRKVTKDRLDSIRKKTDFLKAKNNAKKEAIKAILKMSKKRADTCSGCEYSKRNERDAKYGITICHKANRPLSIIFKDEKFKCPIGKF